MQETKGWPYWSKMLPLTVEGILVNHYANRSVSGKSTLRNLLLWCLPLLALCGTVILYFWPMICSIPFGRHYVGEGDFSNQFYPFHYFAAMEWSRGSIPLWNPYIFAGHPFQADVQTAVFYPLNLLICFANWLVSFITSPGGISYKVLEGQLVLDYMLAAIFMYLFARRLTGSRWAGMIGAIIYALGGFLTTYPMEQMPILECAVWLPLVLLFLERGTTEPRKRWINLGLAGLAMGISILAGHPQTAMYVCYLSLGYFLFRAISNRFSWRQVGLGLVLFLGGAFGIAAVQLFPTLEFFSLSNRGGSLDYEKAGSGYVLASLPGLLLTGWMQEKALYIGAVPLVLATVAWMKQRGQVVFWSIMAVIALLMSLGSHGFLFPALFAFVPGFSLFQDQERVMVVFSLAIAVLAAIGATNLAELPTLLSRRWKWLALVTVPVVAVVWVSVVAWQRSAAFSFDDSLWTSWTRVALIVLVSLVLILAYLKRHVSLTILSLALVLLVAVDLFCVNFGNNLSVVNPLPSSSLLNAVSSLQTHSEPYRVTADNSDVFKMNYGILAKAPYMTGDTPIVLSRTLALLSNSTNGWRSWQLLNVKFWITRNTLGDGYKEVWQGDDTRIYYINYSFPKIWVVNSVKVATGEQQALEVTMAQETKIDSTVVLEQPPRLTIDSQQELKTEWHILDDSPQHFSAQIQTAANGVLVHSEAYYPGWKAYLDGQEVPILRADYALRGVELPAGSHVLEMKYEPLSFRIGLTVTILTLVAIGVLGFVQRRHRMHE